MKKLLLLSCLLWTAVSAQAQPTEPMLTLNTGMHTATIRRISTDARGRYLLTASDDKTAKLWDLRSGALLRTFRPPVGEGGEGRLYAGALSPDGRTVAVGGWTGYSWDIKYSIYLFDANNGTLLRRIQGLPKVILDLEYSPDGRFIVAALGADGIRVYRSADGGLQAQDIDYQGDSYNVAFDIWGSYLATVCYDGYLRLYDADFKLLKKSKLLGGSRPFSLAFSPDSRHLAVGYRDSLIVQVLDASTQAFRYAPNVEGANELYYSLYQLAFSADGVQLAAGGSFSKYENGTWWVQIRCWKEAGKGAFTDISAGQNTIMDLKALPEGGFVFGSAQPDWGMLDVDLRRAYYKEADQLNYATNDKSLFHLGPGGTEIGMTPADKSALLFELNSRRLLEKSSTQPSAATERNDLRISDWSNSTTPKLNGQALSLLQQYETCYSAAVATGGAGFVLGTSWNLYCADVKGKLRWEQPAPDAAWCVNIDPTNQVVAAAFADGTLRWYRFRDGQPLLTLYIHPDRKRWVLWTPSGYFDCAPGAEELLGWHVNQGPDREAAYYPLSKFRERFYRPDIIDRILETLDETTAKQDADAARGKTSARATILDELPPTARILSPTEGTEISTRQIKLSYSLQSPNSEPITGLRILVDGRPIANGRGFKPLGTRLEEPIEVPAANCTVSVIAENRFGASEPATVHLFWKNTAAPASTQGVDIRPKLYVLAIGVSKYQHADVAKLEYADDDARDFAALMLKQKGGIYQDVQTRVLLDGAATKEAILDGLEWLEMETTSRDVAMLFFAGHGVDDRSGNFYYLPATADPNALKRTGVAHGDVQTTVASVAGKIVVFMDACHSGSLMRPIGVVRGNGDYLPEMAPVINELISAENGAVVFCSTTNRQQALEDVTWAHGAFTKALLEGLGGKAFSPGTKKITIKTLDAYVAERVKELTGRRQTPTTAYPPNVPDFPVSYGN